MKLNTMLTYLCKTIKVRQYTVYSGLWCRNLQLYRLLLPIFPPEVLGKAGSGAVLWCGGAVGADPVLKW